MLERLRPYRWWLLGLAVLVVAGGAAYALRELKQGDPRWAKKLLGQSGTTTIAKAGCLLTAVTMAHNLLYRTSLTPDIANDRILAAGGFTGPNMIVPTAARALRLAFDTKKATLAGTPPTLAAHAVDALRRGGVAILHVTYDNDAEGDHFVLVTRQFPDGGFEVYDPGPGKRFALDAQLQGRTPQGSFYYPVKVTQLFRAA